MKIDYQRVLPYIVYILLFFISFGAAWYLPTSEIFKGLIAFPGAIALLSIVYKIWREERAHERNVELQNTQQDFVLGTASHMAEVAYNKHVEFCEEYINRVQLGRQELFREGPSRNTLNIGRELVVIRQKYASWLTAEIEQSLQPFEQALIKIGAHEEVLPHMPSGESRIKMIDEIYSAFGLVLGHQDPLNEEEANLKIDRVIEKIREILGITILTRLRQEAASIALKRLGSID